MHYLALPHIVALTPICPTLLSEVLPFVVKMFPLSKLRQQNCRSSFHDHERPHLWDQTARVYAPLTPEDEVVLTPSVALKFVIPEVIQYHISCFSTI